MLVLTDIYYKNYKKITWIFNLNTFTSQNMNKYFNVSP